MKPAETLVANPRPQTSRAVRRTVALGAAAMVLIGLLLLYLLTQATNNRELYEQNYARLFVVNVVAVISLSEIAPAALQQHVFWGALLAGLAIFGLGRWSLDRWIWRDRSGA